MLNIVIPMAGAGSRFMEAGYKIPKPLIPVNGTPMIQIVVKNLTPAVRHRFIFVCQQAHLELYNLANTLSQYAPGCVVVTVDGLTEGAACTVLAARALINSPDHELMIANSDQWVDVDVNNYLQCMEVAGYDAFMMTMKADDPKWSYVGFNEFGLVERVVEKQVISNEATVGIYNFRRGSDFVECAESMISKNLRTNGEFYVAPVFNALIHRGKSIGVFNVGRVGNGMYGLGTPSDLKLFLESTVISKATKD